MTNTEQTARLALESTLTTAVACAQLAGPAFSETLDQLVKVKRDALNVLARVEQREVSRPIPS